MALGIDFALEFEHSAELLANEKWKGYQPLVHSRISIKLAPAVDCDKLPTDTCTLGVHVVAVLGWFGNRYDIRTIM